MSPSEPKLPFTAKDIVSIRQDLVDSHPASERTSRAIDEPCVESAMQTALQGAYYLSTDGTLDDIHIAGLLLYHIAKLHCFTDGNKRVAWSVAVDYLLRQRLRICATQDEAAQLVEDVCNPLVNKSSRDVIEWLGDDNRLQEVES